MSEHVREGDNRRRDLALDDLDVRVAEAAGFHLEENLPWFRLWPVPLNGLEGLVVSFEEPGFHEMRILSNASGWSSSGLKVDHWYLFFRSKGSRPAHFKELRTGDARAASPCGSRIGGHCLPPRCSPRLRSGPSGPHSVTPRNEEGLPPVTTEKIPISHLNFSTALDEVNLYHFISILPQQPRP